MIKTMLYNRSTGEIQWGEEGVLAAWAENPDLWIWADFDAEDQRVRSICSAKPLHYICWLSPTLRETATRPSSRC